MNTNIRERNSFYCEIEGTVVMDCPYRVPTMTSDCNLQAKSIKNAKVRRMKYLEVQRFMAGKWSKWLPKFDNDIIIELLNKNKLNQNKFNTPLIDKL